MLSSIRSQVRGIDAPCAQAITLHSYAPRHINGGEGEPNCHKIEYKHAKQESREPDYRWGKEAAHVQPDFPTLGSQSPSEAPQPQCATAAMMHGPSRGASSSWQGGCPPIAARTSKMVSSSAPAACHSSESKIQDRGQHLAS